MFKLFKNIFKTKPERFLGIDIGASGIRVVEIAREDHDYRLENYGEAGASVFKDQSFRVYEKDIFAFSDKNIAEIIQAIIKEAGINIKEVNFSIPDFNSFFTNLKLPVMSREKITEAVRYQVRPFIPLPLEEVTLDWSIIKGQPNETPLTVSVVAVPKEIVFQYKEIAELANLDLRLLEPEVFSLTRALVKNKKTKKTISLIDIGVRSTTCSILDEGTIRTSYSFNVAGSELTEAIARSLNIRYNEAEKLKKNYGLVSTDNEENGEFGRENGSVNLSKNNIPKILAPLTDSILEEIKKVFRDFYRTEGKEVNKIILSGGTTLMPGIEKYFSDELKKEVIVADPFSGIAYPPILAATLEKMKPVYGIAVGLALKGFE